MTRLHGIALVGALASAVWLAGPAHGQDRGAQKPPTQYIVWDGHRFARTAKDHERDIRYFKDLGFTHSLLSCAFEPGMAAGHAERIAPLLALCRKYDMTAGLRFGWDFRGLSVPWDQMVAKGMTLRAKPRGDQADYNPVHPEIVRYYADGLRRSSATMPTA